MHDAVVVEAAEHVYDGVALADVGEELVAQAFALAGSLHEAGNIDDVADGRHDAARMHELGETGQSLVGHGDLSKLSINGAKGKVCCLRLCARQTVEEG